MVMDSGGSILEERELVCFNDADSWEGNKDRCSYGNGICVGFDCVSNLPRKWDIWEETSK